VRPTIEGLKTEGIIYKGFIFLGLINVEGEPFVIEYNCRLGDPETQVVLLRICNDLVTLFEAVASGTLQEHTIIEDPLAAVTVTLASGGYPGAYEKGFKITGLESSSFEDALVFHAATKASPSGIYTGGGRVLSVSAYGNDHRKALKRAYEVAGGIRFDHMYYRKDIGFDL
jgi:phosphoribosylamine--glycine ligase